MIMLIVKPGRVLQHYTNGAVKPQNLQRKLFFIAVVTALRHEKIH